MTNRFVRSWFTTSRAVLAPAAVLIAALASGSAAEAQKGGGPSRDIPLIVTFGSVSDGDRITNDLSGPYENKVDNVLAILYDSGNLGFNTQDDTRVAPEREVCFEAGENGLPSEAAGCWNTNENMGGTDLTKIQGMTTPGQTAQKRVRFDWTAGEQAPGSYRYHLGHATDMNGDDQLDSLPALVTCIAAANSKCTSWTVTPQGPAALYKALLTAGKGGKLVVGPNEYVGHYDMSFVQTLTLK